MLKRLFNIFKELDEYNERLAKLEDKKSKNKKRVFIDNVPANQKLYVQSIIESSKKEK